MDGPDPLIVLDDQDAAAHDSPVQPPRTAGSIPRVKRSRVTRPLPGHRGFPPRDVSARGRRGGDGTVARRGPRLGAARVQRLAGRSLRGDPAGLSHRRGGVRRMDVPRAGSTVPSGVDRLHLRRYLASLSTRRWPGPPSPARRRPCAAYFAWSSGGGLSRRRPGPPLPAPSAAGRVCPGSSLEGEVRPQLVGRRTPTAALDRRDDAVLELLYAAGLRVAELCGLDRGGVDLAGRTVTVLGKGAKQRRVPIHDRRSPPSRPGSTEGVTSSTGPPEAVFVNRRGPAWARGRPADPGPPLRRPHPPPRPPPHLSPPTCSTGGRTCGSSRSCWATPACPRPRCTPTSARSGCAASTARPTPGPEDPRAPRRADRLTWPGPPPAGG